MKTDKALQLYNGKTFLHYIINAVLPLQTSITLVSSKKKHQDTKYTCINDLKKNKGPVSAITSALQHSNTNWNLIVCCDTPLIQTTYLEWLMGMQDTKYDAIVGYINDQKMPLTALYHKNCVEAFNKNLENNQLKVMSVLTHLKVNYIAIPKQFHSQLTNVNTPEQLKAISI